MAAALASFVAVCSALPPLALLLFVAGLSLVPVVESDLFFRLRIGQEILARGAIPTENLLSFTYPQHPDLDLAWLFEVLAAGVFRWGGFPAVVVGKTVVLATVFALAYGVCRRRGAGPAASALALAAAALVMRERLVERPHLFSFLGEVALLAVIDRFIETDRPRRLRTAALVFVLVSLWANLHAGAFVAVMILALFAAGAALDRRRTPNAPAPPAIEPAIYAIVATAALMATPAGVGIFRYLWLHLTLPRLHPVDEFRAATWLSDGPLLTFAALIAVATVARWRRTPARTVLPVLGLGLLASQSIRFGADFALLGAPLLATALSSLGSRVAALRPRLAPASRYAPVLVAALLLAAAVTPRARALAGGGRLLSLDVDTALLPLDALRFVEEHDLRRRMYNDFEIGAYLAFQGYPRYRVFVDPRLPAYPEEFHRLLGRADLTRAEWDAALARHQVDSALLAYAGVNRRVAWWEPNTWALVYRRNDARVFVRRSPDRRDFIARHEIPATFRFSAEEGAVTEPIPRPPAGSPVAPCVWQQRLGDLMFELGGDDPGQAARAEIAYRRAVAAPPGCLDAAEERRLAGYLGAIDLQAGRWRDALTLLDRALLHHPAGGDLPTLTNRALALESLGDSAGAALAWGEVAARAGATALGARARQHQARAAAAADAVNSRSETRPTPR